MTLNKITANILGFKTGYTSQKFIATDNQTLFTLTNGSYQTGNGSIEIFVQGVKQTSDAYTETSSTSFTLSEGVVAGTIIEAVWIASYLPNSADVGDVTTLKTSAKTVVPAINEHDDKIGLLNGMAVNVKDKQFGAKGDGVNDDTSAFQNAIDIAYAQGYEVFVPEGTYRINGTLNLPYTIKIRGVNKARDPYAATSERNCTIQAYGQYLFRGKNESSNASTVQLTMEHIFFEGKYSPVTDSVLFKNIQHRKSRITNITAIGFGTIFYGTLEWVSIVSDCNFEGIAKSFINSIAETGGFNSSKSTIVDSFIFHNYINGKPDYNVTLFNLYGSAHSVISDNFIDFAKIAISLSGSSNSMTYNRNIFDYCYRAFKGTVNRSAVTNNVFSKIKNSYKTSYPSPDTEMQNNDWVCIELSGTGSSDLLVSNSLTYDCSNFSLISGYGFYRIKIVSNSYDNAMVKKVDYRAQKSGITDDVTGIFFDDLMYQDFATLPSPSLTGTTTGSITTFDKQIIRYQNKLVFNDNGTWRDMMGTAIV